MKRGESFAAARGIDEEIGLKIEDYIDLLKLVHLIYNGLLGVNLFPRMVAKTF
jgi:hypothetical protein